MDNVDRYLEGLKAENITKQEGNFSCLLFMSFVPEIFPPYSSRYYDFDFKKVLFIAKPRYGVLFFDMETYIKTSRVSYERFRRLEKVDDFREYSDFVNVSERIHVLYSSTNPSELGGYTHERMVSLIREAFESYWDLLSSSIFSEAVDEELIRKMYREAGGNERDFDEFLAGVSMSAFESFSLRSDRQMMTYLKDRSIHDSLWIFTDYHDAVDLHRFDSKMKEAMLEKGGEAGIRDEIKRIESEIRMNTERLKTYRATLESPLRKLFDFIQLSMKTRDIRKEPQLRIMTIIAAAVKEVLVRVGVPVDFAPNATYSDFFTDRYRQVGYVEELEQRKRCVVFCDFKGLHFEYSDPDAAIGRIYDVFASRPDMAGTDIHGAVAQKGFGKGTVKVIFGGNDFDSFEKGDVLVTSMTRTEYVPLMRKASAIVTDEGGLTCHAAIVSRELGIPCIIGTKNATRILHDGDLVEVDADQGVVRVVKRASENQHRPMILFGYRDFTLGVQEIGQDAESLPLPHLDGRIQERPYFVTLREGNRDALHIDAAQVKRQKDEILDRVREDTGYVDMLLEKLRQVCDPVMLLCNEPRALLREELSDFVFDLRTAWRWYAGLWWAVEVLEENGLNADLVEKMMEYRRSTDRFVPGADETVRRTILGLYPERKEYAEVILLSEAVADALPSEGVLRERMKRCLLADCIVYTGEAIEQFLNDRKVSLVLHDASQYESGEIRGQVAYPGHYRGRVSIVFTKADSERFEQGNVLVSSSSTPDFLPAIKKAGAIVADEGGIISHAAICSREFKIPCIIGTKIATQVLHDGDLVEVDADHGVVRVMENADEKSSDWIYYLSRPFSLLEASFWHSWYACSYFNNIFGTVLSNSMLIENRHDVFTYYVKKTEYDDILFKTRVLLEKNKNEVLSLLREAEKINEKALFLIGKNTGKERKTIVELLDFYNKLAVYSTILPYFVGNYIEIKCDIDKQILDICTRLRSKSYYQNYYEKVLYPELRLIFKERSENFSDVLTFKELNETGDEIGLLKRLKGREENLLYVYVISNGSETVRLVDDIERYKRSNGIFDTDIDSNDLGISGVTAYPGKIQGKIKKVLNSKTIDFFEGEIIVSISTNPTLLPYLKKASAFITDEGGIICHAAIIARELKKPCIIGTKIATQVLHDGDLVEVDADQGVVRVLKRA